MNLEKMTLLELRAYGKKIGVKSVTTFPKGVLIEKIKAALEGSPSGAEPSEKSAEKPTAQKAVRPGKDQEPEAKAAAPEVPENTASETNDESDKNRQSVKVFPSVNIVKEPYRPFEPQKSYEPRSYRPVRSVEPADSYNFRGFAEPPKKSPVLKQEEPAGAAEAFKAESSREPKEASKSGDSSDKVNLWEADESQEAKYHSRQRTTAVEGGVLEIMAEGYGFLRKENYMPGNNDVYINPTQIKRFNLRPGDYIEGVTRIQYEDDKYNAIIYINSVNGDHPGTIIHRPKFERLTPIYPDEKLKLETTGSNISTRTIDLISPIGKGQRGMIVAQPKAGKTVLIKNIANALKTNYPDIKIIILLVDERPEEVTDMQDSISGENVEVIYSTFDEHPEHHKKVAEMTLERAKRLVEQKKDVVILLDSITRLARAYNLTAVPGGRTLSGGLDAGALFMPKKFFGAARNIREGGSLTILATALVETGSRLDDMVYEEFKGTGNMELVLDRRLAEKRIFPAIDIVKSSTRREEDLLSPEELEAVYSIRRSASKANLNQTDDNTISFNDLMKKTKNNEEFIQTIKKINL